MVVFDAHLMACQWYRSVTVCVHQCLPRITLVSSSTAMCRWSSTSLQSAEQHTLSFMPFACICSSLTWSWAVTLALSLVISKSDYGNCLLCNLPVHLLHTLQLVQNSAARMVCQAKNNAQITPALHALHWLTIQQRTEYKILFLVFKALRANAPQYLEDVLWHYQPVRLLWSASQDQLVKPVSNNSYNDHTFAIVGPCLWNSLPLSLTNCRSLQSFKRGLKTHLFKITYGNPRLKTHCLLKCFLDGISVNLLVTLSRWLVLLWQGPYEHLWSAWRYGALQMLLLLLLVLPFCRMTHTHSDLSLTEGWLSGVAEWKHRIPKQHHTL